MSIAGSSVSGLTQPADGPATQHRSNTDKGG
jgi:hypothetical protein